MTYDISILAPDEILRNGLYCRALEFQCRAFSDCEYTQINAYGGVINNYKWIKIEEVLGEYWLDGTFTIKDFWGDSNVTMEFAEGNFPPWSVTNKQDLLKESAIE